MGRGAFPCPFHFLEQGFDRANAIALHVTFGQVDSVLH